MATAQRTILSASALVASIGLTAPARAQLFSGACCLPTGSCVVTLQAGCTIQNGTWYGTGSSCAQGCEAGACCLPNLTCTVTPGVSCAVQNGVWHGAGTTCSLSCTQGACCLPDGGCIITLGIYCTPQGGVWHGVWTQCNQSCPLGACCLPGGACQPLLASSCVSQGGVFQGVNTPCRSGSCGPTDLYAIDYSSGQFIWLDKATGQGTAIGLTGFPGAIGAAADSQGRIFINPTRDRLIQVNPRTGAGTVVLALSGWPSGYGVRGMAFDPADHLYASLSTAATSTTDLLATINTSTGAYTIIGDTGQADIQSIAFIGGDLYAAGVFGGLYQLDPSTGAATVIGGSFGQDGQALTSDRETGTLYSARVSLRTVNPATGGTTVVGPTGFGDIRGLAVIPHVYCYPNCDGSTTTPVLNVLDFACFLNRFAAGDPYANCDNSTTPPVLNVLDFACFLNRFAAGCS